MIDPLAVIFLPGATAGALVLFVGPLVAIRRWQWRRQARVRNARFRCAWCSATLVIDELHLFQGAHICGGCAGTLRRRFAMAVPAALVVALGFGLSSLAALAVSVTTGGPSLSWWLDGRWIPLLLPSAGLAAATVAFVRLGQRANRLRAASPWVAFDPGEVQRWDSFPLKTQDAPMTTPEKEANDGSRTE